MRVSASCRTPPLTREPFVPSASVLKISPKAIEYRGAGQAGCLLEAPADGGERRARRSVLSGYAWRSPPRVRH